MSMRQQYLRIPEWIKSRKCPKWLELKSILENKAIKTSYTWIFLIPIIVRITSGFPEKLLIGGLSLDPGLELHLSLPFKWYLLYFSALFFGASYLVFLFFAPEFLRNYSNPGQAVSDGLTVQYVRDKAADFLKSDYRHLPGQNTAEGDLIIRIMQQYRARWISEYTHWSKNKSVITGGEKLAEAVLSSELRESFEKPGFYVLPAPEKILRWSEEKYNIEISIQKSVFFQHVCWDLLNLQNISRNYWRILSTILFLLGTVCMSFVFIENILFVLSSFCLA